MRHDTPILYDNDEEFPIGGSKVLRQSDEDAVTILATGATVHEALAAHERLRAEGIATRVIDVHSLQPIDTDTPARGRGGDGCLDHGRGSSSRGRTRRSCPFGTGRRSATDDRAGRCQPAGERSGA